MLTMILVIVVGFLIIAMILIAFAYPELFVRGWKFLFRTVRHAAGQPTLRPEQEEAKAKAKKLAPYMALAGRIEQITPGQSLRHKIVRETWGGDFVTVELNPQYPQKGRKYILSIENMVNGMPGGKKTIMYDSDKSIEIANSIHDRDGELFVVAEETPVNAEKKGAENTGKAGTVA